jgi:tetratricopeptide (TPR) repeat protein
MVALDFYYQRKWRSPKILIFEKLPFWMLSLVFGLINVYFLSKAKTIGGDADVIDYSAIDHLAVGAYTYVTYLAKWIFPYMMSPVYPYQKLLQAGAYISLAILPAALIVFLIWAFRTKQKNLLFGWAFFTINIMFLLQIVGAGQAFLADRFTYIAYIGLFFLMAKGYDWVNVNYPGSKRILHGIIFVYLLSFAFITMKQIHIWQNGGTLWEHAKKYYPNNELPWRNAANYYRDEEKNYSKAIEYYSTALQLKTNKAPIYNSLGKAYFDQAVSLNAKLPDFPKQKERLTNLSIQNYSLGIMEDSMMGRRNSKTTSELFINLGVAYALLEIYEKALVELGKGLQLDSTNKNGYLNRGILYQNTGQYSMAIQDYDKYLQLNPYHAEIYYERGVCKRATGKETNALIDFDMAISLNSQQPLFYIERSKARRVTGNIFGSREDAAQAQQMGAQVPPELLK